MPTALAGSHGAKAYGASSGVVGDDNFWAVTMARSHGSAVPLPHRALDMVWCHGSSHGKKNFSITRKRENARRGTASRVFTSCFRPPSRLVVAARDAKTPPTVWFSRRGLVFSPMAQAASHRTLCSKWTIKLYMYR
ncbi:hypothetical protein Tco_0860991 [Tanacetum coccineum]|uniref:Uncharacterized protein n=1 Tax=Tanacetum coccineum TaxID=301880 RepID=A0ABQ5BKL6_9ASTR